MKKINWGPTSNTTDPSPALQLIELKHLKFYIAGHLYCAFYYIPRLTVGLSAGALPFTITHSPTVATMLSATIVAATVVDLVFNPKESWVLYSRATDLLAIARLKVAGDYEKY